MPAVDVPRRYPVLTIWMDGARPDHPFAEALSRPDAEDHGQSATLDEVEAVLTTLHVAAPHRLDGKRDEFRALGRDPRAVRRITAELVFAAYLARHGIAFAFGAPNAAHPDLILRNVALGVDITTRKADAVWELRNQLAFAIQDVRPRGQLDLEFSAHPFAIRSTVKKAIVDEVRAAVAAGETEVHCVVRPASDDHPGITLRITIAEQDGVGVSPRVTVRDSGALLTPLMSDIEDALVVAMEDERTQRRGRVMPTMLVVDIAHMSGAWSRPAQWWGDRLMGLIQPQHGFAALAIMVTSGWTTDFQFMLAESRYATPSALESLRRFERALGLTQTKPPPGP